MLIEAVICMNIKRILISFAFMYGLTTFGQVKAQTDVPEPSENVTARSNFILVSANGFSVIDPDSSRTVFSSPYLDNEFSTTSNTVSDVVLDSDWNQATNSLFVVRGPFVQGDSTPVLTRVEQINMLTGESSLVYADETIWRLVVSPDGSHISILYFEGPVGLSRMWMCILTVITKQCGSSQPVYDATYVEWVDSQALLVFTIGIDLYLLDSLTLQKTSIPLSGNWYFESVAIVPNTRTLMITASQINPIPSTSVPDRLLVYDLDKESIVPFGYQVNAADVWFSLDTGLLMSPNGQYLIIFGMEVARIIDMVSQTPVIDIRDIYTVVWVQDNHRSLVVQSISQGNDLTTLQLISVNMQTGEHTVVPIDVNSQYIVGL
jgi:hypothetical protein